MKNLVNKLISSGKTISTMESCTGGGVANAITNIPGASEIIKFSAVTYSNEFKVKMGVSASIIDKYSVYSRKTANAMSKAISDFTLSSYGIGITGKLLRSDPVNNSGLDNEVYISIYDREKDLFYEKSITVVYESREDNKNLVILEIVDLMNKILNGELVTDTDKVMIKKKKSYDSCDK